MKLSSVRCLHVLPKNLGRTTHSQITRDATKRAYSSFISYNTSTSTSTSASLQTYNWIMPTSTSTSTTPTSSFHSSTRRLLSASASSSSGSDILASFGNKSNNFEGNNIASAMEALANADAVCFDVDSTVIQEEGIDVLAESLGKGEEVSAWTKKAMDGNTKFEDALAARLAIIQPSRQSIEKCLIDHPLQLSPGVETFIESLLNHGIDVFLVSGGFRIMIEPIAKILCVGKDNIYANTIFFDDDTTTTTTTTTATTGGGEYVGFCREEPTSADMGKPKAVQKIKDEHGYKTVVMIGDGATDAQAKPPADAFIGFGGVIVREAVKDKACWFVKDFAVLTDVIEKHGHNKLK